MQGLTALAFQKFKQNYLGMASVFFVIFVYLCLIHVKQLKIYQEEMQEKILQIQEKESKKI